MATKYKYLLNGQGIETLDISAVPLGLSFDTIEYSLPIEKSASQIAFEQEKERTLKREIDGLEAYRNTQIALRQSRLYPASGIPVSDEIYDQYVYSKMDKTIQAVRSGNWLSAKNNLNNVIENQYLTAGMILSFKNQIANYIVYSGNYLEYVGKTVNPATGVIS